MQHASLSCDVPLERLSIAKPPTVGSKAITPKLLASLKWDEPKILSCAKVGSFPLQLRDGDLILLRDLEGVEAPAAKAAGGPPAAAKGGRGRGAGGNKPWQHTVVGGGARVEAGLSIKTCFDEPKTEAAASVEVSEGANGTA